MTPNQQQEAIDLLHRFVFRGDYIIYHDTEVECNFCDAKAGLVDDLPHLSQCPVARAERLLAAVESEDAK